MRSVEEQNVLLAKASKFIESKISLLSDNCSSQSLEKKDLDQCYSEWVDLNFYIAMNNSDLRKLHRVATSINNLLMKIMILHRHMNPET